MLFRSEILLEFGRSRSIGVGQVADNLAVFQEGDAGGDVNGVLQVMAGDDNRSMSLTSIVADEVLQHQLAGGVEEVEGFVENDGLGLAQ